METATALSLIPGLVIALFVAFTVLRAVRIVPQARARNVERLGRYDRTLQPAASISSSPTSTGSIPCH